MKLAMIGLGKMGANMARRLHASGHELVVSDVMIKVADSLAKELSGAGSVVEVAHNASDVISLLPEPRVAWLGTCEPGGRGTLCKDGTQRHRVRHDAGLRGGL